jgi:hypothetical protein
MRCHVTVITEANVIATYEFRKIATDRELKITWSVFRWRGVHTMLHVNLLIAD